MIIGNSRVESFGRTGHLQSLLLDRAVLFQSYAYLQPDGGEPRLGAAPVGREGNGAARYRQGHSAREGAFAGAGAKADGGGDACKERNRSHTQTHNAINTTDGLQYKGDTSTHAQGTDPKVALGA